MQYRKEERFRKQQLLSTVTQLPANHDVTKTLDKMESFHRLRLFWLLLVLVGALADLSQSWPSSTEEDEFERDDVPSYFKGKKCFKPLNQNRLSR